MDFLFGNRRSVALKGPPANVRSSVNYSQQAQTNPQKKQLPPTPQQLPSNYQLNAHNRSSVSIQPLPTKTLPKSISMTEIGEMSQQDSATVKEVMKFLSPYVTEPKVTGYSIDHFPQSFIEPYNAFSPRKYGEVQVDLMNVEQQMTQYEALIQNYGPENFSSSVLSNLITLFGNSPNTKVQEQLLSIFKRVVPHKSSELYLEYWSVLNIVYRNCDAYALRLLLEFCNLSQYFDPTSSEVDPDVLNLSLSVCIRMCEKYPDKVPSCWNIFTKILYKHANVIKLTQHWDGIVKLYSRTNKLQFSSLVRMVFRDHEEFLLQQLELKDDKFMPINLYLELLVILVQLSRNAQPCQHGVNYLDNVFINQVKQWKNEKNVPAIIQLPKSLSLVYQFLLYSIRIHSTECELIYSYLKQFSELDDDWLLIETSVNSIDIQTMDKHLLDIYEECALALDNDSKSAMVSDCISFVARKGGSLRARLLQSQLKNFTN